jgi:Holliday junction resolvase
MLGERLQDLVQSELRAHGFKIIDKKDSRQFGGRTWDESKHMLDVIAKNEKMTIGVEIKNTLYPTPVSEVKTKIKICQHLGLISVFACRWMEQHRRIIELNNGLLWQFKK